MELQEVEYVLRTALPAKSQVAVELVKPYDAPELPMLTAFCALAQDSIKVATDSRSVAKELRMKLAEALPTHMVPRAFIFLENLPGGYKTNRKKLRTDASLLGLEALLQTIECRSWDVKQSDITESEQALIKLWAKVLHVSETSISKRDNFIALGGDSMAAIRLVVAARTEGIQLTSQTVQQQPILEDMADAANHSTIGAIQVPNRTSVIYHKTATVKATDFQAWAALVGASNGGWIDHFGYDFSGLLDVHKLRDSCQQLVAAHDVLGAVFLVIDHEVYMRSPADEEVAFQVHQTTVPELEKLSKEIYAQDRIVPLGHPIVRFDLLQAGPTRHRLIMRISHAQYDGFCAPLIDEHLRRLYLSKGSPRTLPFAKYTQFVHSPDFVQNAELYWKTYLKDSSMPQLVQYGPACQRLPNTLDCEHTVYLPAPSLQHEGINPATVVKSTWALVLMALSQSSDIVFGEFISGRQTDLAEIETVIGPCVNFTPVRVRLQKGVTNRSLLQQVQADHLAGIPCEALGFRRIIEHCASWGSATRYSSIVNFIAVETHMASQPQTWSDGNAKDDAETLDVTSLYEEQQHDKTDLWLLCRHSRQSVERGDTYRLELRLRYSSNVYSTPVIERITELFAQKLRDLAEPAGLEASVEIPWNLKEERQNLIPRVA